MTDRPPEFDRDVIAALPRLRSYAISMTKNYHRAEDAVSSAVVLALRGWEQFKPGTNLEAWLTTILRNHFYSGARKSRREAEDPDDVWASTLTVKPNQTDSIELRETLRAIREMDREMRTCLLMIADGYSYEEISGMLGIAVGTVKSQVSRARAILRRETEATPDLEREASVEPEIHSRRAIVELLRQGKSVTEVCEALGAERRDVRELAMERLV